MRAIGQERERRSRAPGTTVGQRDVAAEVDEPCDVEPRRAGSGGVGLRADAVQSGERDALALEQVLVHVTAEPKIPGSTLVEKALVVDANDLEQAVGEDRECGGGAPGVTTDGCHVEADVAQTLTGTRDVVNGDQRVIDTEGCVSAQGAPAACLPGT